MEKKFKYIIKIINYLLYNISKGCVRMKRIYGSRYIATYIISCISFILFIVFLILSIKNRPNSMFITFSVITFIISLLCIIKIFFIPIYHISYNEYDDIIYIKLKDYTEYEIKPEDILDIKLEVIKAPTYGNLTLILKDKNINFHKIHDIQEVKKEIEKLKE